MYLWEKNDRGVLSGCRINQKDPVSSSACGINAFGPSFSLIFFPAEATSSLLACSQRRKTAAVRQLFSEAFNCRSLFFVLGMIRLKNERFLHRCRFLFHPPDRTFLTFGASKSVGQRF